MDSELTPALVTLITMETRYLPETTSGRKALCGLSSSEGTVGHADSLRSGALESQSIAAS